MGHRGIGKGGGMGRGGGPGSSGKTEKSGGKPSPTPSKGSPGKGKK